MKSVISITFDDKYFFFLPITVWCWYKLNVDTICFMPFYDDTKIAEKMVLIRETIKSFGGNMVRCGFDAPEHKESTYAQCARLYGACLDLPEDEVLITSDVDMAVFGGIFNEVNDGGIHSIGGDLLDKGMRQFPLCYIVMPVKDWKIIMDVNGRSFQQCLDESVGKIECEHFKGNQWSLDQNTIYNQFEKHWVTPIIHNRAKMPERFALDRLDRDDSYILERGVEGVVDYHMNRPGYENIETILTIFQKIYPNENFDWIREYTNAYKQLL